MNIHKAYYEDKVKACWIGKNIGGTMGAPFEGRRTMQNISGFTTKKGEPLPNDDLDLQLLWLAAVEEQGIRQVTSSMLGEYWLSFVPAHWNEYGVAKANLRLGLRPPLSGEFANETWKHSNGAWIRTEIWACLFPAHPDLAVKYAYRDACVDHGLGEGTEAAMFVAAMESAAFVEKDIRKLITIGLSYIKETSYMARTVNYAISLYDAGTEFIKAREALVKFTEELGWFQAPGNVGFVILGLLYGEGDYKKSMIYAINCGDDTDCTGATVGSLMGILGGTEIIPQDWAEYIGDSIKSIALDLTFPKLAKSCSELTQRIVRLMPMCFKAYEMDVDYVDSGTIETGNPSIFALPSFGIPFNPFTYEEFDLMYAYVRIGFDRMPCIRPGESLKILGEFLTKNPRIPKNVSITLHLPEGWSVDGYKKVVALNQFCDNYHPALPSTWEVTVTAGENVSAKNIIYLELSSDARPASPLLPITILG